MYFDLSKVDRGIYEAIREEAVSQGYLPDVLVANTKSLYDAAIANIKTSGKQPIDLYGVGSWKAKSEKRYNAIILRRTARNLSSLGHHGEVFYEDDGNGRYNKVRTPFETATLSYTVTLLCDDVVNERILQDIVYKALGVMKPIKGMNPDGTKTENDFTIFRAAVIDQSGEDFIEVIINYNTSEIFLQENEILEGNIAKIQTINFEINP